MSWKRQGILQAKVASLASHCVLLTLAWLKWEMTRPKDRKAASVPAVEGQGLLPGVPRYAKGLALLQEAQSSYMCLAT